MTLLDFEEKKPLAQRFGFLNIAAEDGQACKQVPAHSSRKNESTLMSRPALEKEAFSTSSSPTFVDASDMLAVCVAKTSIDSGKLFINIAALNPDGASNHLQEDLQRPILLSAVSIDVDKAGKECQVLTALDVKYKKRAGGYPEDRVRIILIAIRDQLGIEVNQNFTLPKMRKKGQLSSVTIDQASAVPLSPGGSEHFSTQTKRPMVTELSPDASNVPDCTAPRLQPLNLGKHKISQFQSEVLATPLPTTYSHHLSIPLPGAAMARSWSVYYDSQDRTLKVLLPPEENFITVAADQDDFRAFTRDEVLHIFYRSK